MRDSDLTFEGDASLASSLIKTCSVCGKRLSMHNKIGRCFHHPDPKQERQQLEREALVLSAQRKKHRAAIIPTLGVSIDKPEQALEIRNGRRPLRGDKGYAAQKEKLVLHTGEKGLFDELITLGREEAFYAARYFCLKDEPYKTHDELVAEGSFPAIGSVAWAIISVTSIVRYLDPSFFVSKQAASHAEAIGDWVLRRRDVRIEEEDQGQYLEKVRAFGISEFPKEMPERFFDFYLKLVETWNKGRFIELKDHPRLLCLIATRWGFEDGRFYSLQDIAEVEHLTRSRIQQMEQQALRKLGISNRSFR